MLFPSPSRGSYFSIICPSRIYCLIFSTFPSPSRGSYFSIELSELMNGREKSFRPLPGDLISQSDNFPMSGLPCVVSVPFPGILFLNNMSFPDILLDLFDVSVPFPGILFLNSTSFPGTVRFCKWFPSPSRGSYFSMKL